MLHVDGALHDLFLPAIGPVFTTTVVVVVVSATAACAVMVSAACTSVVFGIIANKRAVAVIAGSMD
jgi:hypothetical protein